MEIFWLWLILFLITVTVLYHHVKWNNIITVYKMWFTKEYWTAYNTVEALSWLTKAIIIIPGLLFGIEVWQFYILALFTSITLVWASNCKLLPTLVAFNTMWIGMSIYVILKNIL